ncbi:ribonucleoside-diphosphate reductase alpha chain [Methanolinea mesophila]|uniref:adenosylcobalamin-dependent ribonucleoside-diphosphate reductase n=1 Tax=Methanolinea mesophila TaxID=547055 RepID=UPI001AE5A6C9|nr:adenosylcobalamin-dependent ribonucleoside-diphosphate reductase [Methanolinea mesophila]MBP1929417.1 ribonucleoside-diphosphate reductase alpha chain [Methanolinea mesophila]
MDLSRAGRILLESRYLLPGETPEEMARRVSGAVDTGRSDEFRKVIDDLLFLPNSPTLMNAGLPDGQLSACFVLPVEDSIEGIFRTLNHMALIHKSGGGTGFSFSSLRPCGDLVAGTAGVASGPLPFIQVFDEATNALRQGGRRRGANMGVLSISHPDIACFIEAKKGGGLSNFNISVGLDDAFFSALDRGAGFDLVNPRDGAVWETKDSRELWDLLCRNAWACGDPGVLFLDEINRANKVPGLGRIEATNPCGEQPLLPYESCNLGSVNLARCVTRGEIDFELLRETVRCGVAFLDAVIDVNRFPLPRIDERTRSTRKIGLGVMGLADALIAMAIPYASTEGLNTTDRIMAAVEDEAVAMSREIGEQLGSFPALNESVYTGPMRNGTVTTVAPTGSLHLIAGTSSGIEPVFSLAFDRLINGERFSFVHPALKKLLEGRPGGHALMQRVKRTGSLQGLGLPEDELELFLTAAEIPPEFHVQMQATVQKHTDNAVSKTVNLPEEATPGDVGRIFLLARELGCKGITVYRYRSKADQVLSRGCETCRVDSWS